MKINSNELYKSEDIRVPSGAEYESAIAKSIDRRTAYTRTENELITVHKYEISGMIYTVNSIFPVDINRTADDNIKHLITGEIHKVS